MAWFALVWAALATVLIFALVGGSLARIIGLRGFWLVAAAPAFAVTIISGTAVVAPWLGLSWSLLAVVVVTIVVGGLLAVLRFTTRRLHPVPAPRRKFDWWLLFGLAAAAVIISARIALVLGAPGNISQTFDNIFHLNAVRFVLDTGDASSLWIGRMTYPGGSQAFYPAAWHAVVALVVQVSGVSIPVAVNAMTIVVSAIVWPLGILLLTRTIFGRSRVLSVSAGLLAAAMPVFPFLLMDYGVLYPYQLGVALVPAALAATMGVLRLAPGMASVGRIWWIVALIGIVPGLVLAHPSAFVAWLAFTAPMVVVFVTIRWRAASSAGARWVLAAGFVAYLAVGALLVLFLRPPSDARGWTTTMTIWDAIVDVITLSAWYQVPAVLAAIAVVSGLFWAFSSRSVPAIVAIGLYLVAAVLFITVAAGPILSLRDALTGPWYNNLPRLAALLPIAMVPLGAYGVAGMWSRASRTRFLRSRVANQAGPLRAGIAVLTAVAAALAMQLGPLTPMPVAQDWTSRGFVSGPNSWLLSADERAVIERMDEIVPEDVTVAGNPWTGAALAYALADRRVLMPHTLMEVTNEMREINDGLADAMAGDAVCDALEALDVGFVLDFGTQEVHPGVHDFPGLTGLADSDAVRLVDEQGDAKLYEITACNR